MRLIKIMGKKAGKKGEVEVQFNWMLVLIIGALILLGFFGFSQKQKIISEAKLAEETLTQLNLALSGSKVSADTANIITVPKKRLEFSCNLKECNEYGCPSSFTIEDSGISKPYNTHALFSPNFLEGEGMTTWALDWSIPYRSANFIYVTNPSVRYIIVYNASDEDSRNLAFAINNSVPSRVYDTAGKKAFSFELVKVSELYSALDSNNFKVEDQNNFKIKLIFTGNAFKNQNIKLGHESMSAIKIKPETETLDGFGNIEFYKYVKNSNSGILYSEKPYFGKASLFGAIFSEDASSYECNMRKGINSAIIMTKINKARINDLEKETTSGACKANYGFAKDNMEAIEEELGKAAKANLTRQSFQQLNSLRQELESLNSNIQRLSCPTIY